MASVINANAVRALRKSLGLTQKQLGARLGVRNITVYDWERGLYRMPRHQWSRALADIPHLPRAPSVSDIRAARKITKQPRWRAAESIGVPLRTWDDWESGRYRMPRSQWAIFCSLHGLSPEALGNSAITTPDGFYDTIG